MPMKYKLAKGWTKRRWGECRDLQELLREVSSLNTANGHVERTQRCIKTAKRLLSRSKDRTRDSFIGFLESLALIELPEGQP